MENRQDCNSPAKSPPFETESDLPNGFDAYKKSTDIAFGNFAVPFNDIDISLQTFPNPFNVDLNKSTTTTHPLSYIPLSPIISPKKKVSERPNKNVSASHPYNPLGKPKRSYAISRPVSLWQHSTMMIAPNSMSKRRNPSNNISRPLILSKGTYICMRIYLKKFRQQS